MTRANQDPNRPAKEGRRSFWRSKGGNVAVITALVAIPLTFALGMAYDFTMAQSRKDQIDGMADVATLGSVTPNLMTQSASNSKTQAVDLFNGQIATVNGVIYDTTTTAAGTTAADTTSANTVNRTVTLSYHAASKNIFATLLGMPSFPISGASQAVSSAAPNINFYLLLDTSPSMEIAATTAGITQLQGLTTAQQTGSTPTGCAFGCHETNPTAGDVTGNPGGIDNYALARNNNIVLRMDLVTAATANLMTVAQQTGVQDGAAYQVGIYTSDVGLNEIQPLTSNFTTAQTAANGIKPLTIYSNNQLTSSTNNSDEDTAFDADMLKLNSGGWTNGSGQTVAALPSPGNGTNNAGDTPQEVLFIVTDGLNDTLSGGSRAYFPLGQGTGSPCTTIKTKGIRIAVLYTTYNPLDSNPHGGNTWYDLHVASVQPNIATDAAACASPGLFFAVDSDGDISAALVSLFQKAVATARLTQ